MASDYRKTMVRIFVGYERVHKDTKTLFTKLKKVSSQGVILIPVARGGWPTARILAASYEEEGIENHSYSISATYKKHRTPNEYVVLTQTLDENAIKDIRAVIARNIPIVVDSVSKTARELLAVQAYLQTTFPDAEIFTAVMNQVEYEQAPKTPWRTIELRPDFYGSLIKSTLSPYVEYPWEYSLLEDFKEQEPA